MLPINAALLVIDVQQGFEDPAWGDRNNLEAEANIANLLDHWRTSGRPVIHVHHHSAHADGRFHPDKPGVRVKPEAAPLPGETVIVKRVNSGFIGTNLEELLRARGIATLILVGLTTDHCVSTTARMAGNLGFTTYVVADATATFERRDHQGRSYSASQLHETALASLHGEFATIISCDAVRQASGGPVQQLKA